MNVARIVILLCVTWISMSNTPYSSTNDVQSIANSITYSLDVHHSFILFKTKRFGASYVFGTFNRISGSLEQISDNNQLTGSLTIDPTSINTGMSIRDENLREELFLNVADHAKIAVNLLSINKVNKHHVAEIEISLLGVVKTMNVQVEVNITPKDPTGKNTIAINGSHTLDTTQFGMKMDKKLPDGSPLIENNVNLEFSLLFEK